MDDLTGQRLNDFQLLRQLGRGAMASVYLAEQQSLSRRVAVKVLASELCRDQAYVDRFQHEARAAASLTHPGIVQVYEVGATEIAGVRRHYIAQEYVAGGTLGREVQRSGVLKPARVLDVLWQVTSALEAAAERRLVHRDIKPDNLMLDRSGGVKVADFGLARLVEANGPRMTQAGIAMGTPLYMSPEQIEGGDVDARSDLYSLGVTAYQLLAGDPPFTGETPLSVAVQHLNNAPDPVTERCPSAPASLASTIDRLIAKKPDDRFGSPAKLLSHLAEVARAGQAEGWVTGSGGRASSLVGGSTVAPDWTPRSPDDVDAVSRLSAAMRAETHRTAGTQPRHRRRLLVGTLVGLLLGAVIGRGLVPESRLRARGVTIERFETVKEQLFYAKNADTPAAWRAVLEYHPETDAYYQRLAARGLALCGLRRDDNAVAVRALKQLPTTADANGQRDLVVAAARVVAYGRTGRDDAARTAGAVLSAASPGERARAERLAPDVFAECDEILQRLG